MRTTLLPFLHRWLYPKGIRFVVLVVALVFSQLMCGALVYLTGGTQVAYLHIFYLPIVLSGIFFSMPGGILAGILAGLILGPWMPLDIASGQTQPTYSWVSRAFFFLFVGGLSGFSSQVFRSYLHELKTKYSSHPITKLPNLYGLRETFTQMRAQTDELAVVVIAITNLTEIERAIGPAEAGELLIQITTRLQKIVPAEFVVGHLHTSDFILLVPNPHNLEVSISQFQERLGRTYTVNNVPLFVELCSGAAITRDSDLGLSAVARRAHVALEQASKKLNHFAIFAEQSLDDAAENVAMLHSLSYAIDQNDLDLWYQPKIDLINNKVIGVEALARWDKHVGPATFMPLLERTALIHPFTIWLIERGVNDLNKFKSQGFDITLALNFSIRNFHDKKVLDKLYAKVAELKISPADIEIEVTESAVVTDLQEVVQSMEDLRKRGFKISIDDFGTGQASQQYLFAMPIDGIKIDKIFIDALGEKPAAQSIVKSAVYLGEQLNLSVVAEGVESEQQKELLLKLGCKYGQGFLLAKPIPASEFINWLPKWNQRVSTN